jgi:hypothetical protein
MVTTVTDMISGLVSVEVDYAILITPYRSCILSEIWRYIYGEYRKHTENNTPESITKDIQRYRDTTIIINIIKCLIRLVDQMIIICIIRY